MPIFSARWARHAKRKRWKAGRAKSVAANCGCTALAHKSASLRLFFSSRGGTGRRVRLRTVWGNPWRFESSREQLLSSYDRPLVATAVAYFAPAFLLAAQRAFISSESRFRPAGVSAPFFRLEAVCVPPAFLLAAQRAFISWESFLRPAGVS